MRELTIMLALVWIHSLESVMITTQTPLMMALWCVETRCRTDNVGRGVYILCGAI